MHPIAIYIYAAHGMVYFLFNAYQNTNYCIPEGHGSATLFTRPFLPFCVGGDYYTRCMTLSLSCILHVYNMNCMTLYVLAIASCTLLCYKNQLATKLMRNSNQKVTFSYGTPLAVTMLSLWLSARCTSHQA